MERKFVHDRFVSISLSQEKISVTEGFHEEVSEGHHKTIELITIGGVVEMIYRP